ncbi:MAG: hypothetical protein C4519_07310 [Desulfobacteraceae bacterium]|nr:MAG: hypothetical protein C4519_07310 [Desulfobacteraceae bacterium]
MKIAADIATTKPAQVFSDSVSGSDSRPKRLAEKPRDLRAAPATEPDITPAADQVLLSRLEAAHADRQSFAQQIRAVDKTMELIEENVQNMQDSLEGVVKIYPPYPQDSIERIQALRQFATLRKMIDQLTVPPMDDSPAKILGDQGRFPEAGDWEIFIGKEGRKLTIGRQPVHAGKGGLNLPDLSSDASDASLRQALDSLVESKETLQRRREGFAADANRAIAAML